ncbi:Neprilysin-11 [Hypsibius exemplaris]|uniref:Neprilysin-11 n=1 Tax=Hypsibius exemplaris TaxID=2072580 RepID=A0A9X6RKF2_HYPEX|nr:Neprilysin-11 [Hypsibius exemplaris]
MMVRSKKTHSCWFLICVLFCLSLAFATLGGIVREVIFERLDILEGQHVNIKNNGTTNTSAVSDESMTESTTDLNNTSLPVVKVNVTACETQYCRDLALAAVMGMNTSVSVCNDFYEYACGGWKNRNPTGDSDTRWDLYVSVREKVNAELRDVLERKDTGDSSSAHQKARALYKSCVNSGRMESPKPWLSLLESTVGRFPFFINSRLPWNATAFDWLSAVKRTAQYGIDPFLSFSVILNTDQPGRSSDTITTKAWITIYGICGERLGGRARARQIFVKEQGLDVVENQGNEEAGEDYEAKVQHDNMTLGQFHSRCLKASMSLEQLLEYVRGRMPSSAGPQQHLVTQDLVVKVKNPGFFLRVHNKLAELSRNVKSQGVLANYIGWIVAHRLWPHLPKSVQDGTSLGMAHTTSEGTEASRKNWRVCVKFAKEWMKTAVGSLYATHYYDHSKTSKIQTMVEEIRLAFSSLLKSASWLDDQTKANAVLKLASTTAYIGYLPYITADIPTLDQEYSNLLVGSDLFQNVLSLRQYYQSKAMSRIFAVQTRFFKGFIDAVEVNARHVYNKNVIKLPAALLQNPFYDDRQPAYMKYARMGATIGHELAHGFESEGSKYDGEGNQIEWWTAESKQQFALRQADLITRYNSFTLPKAGSVNGTLTLNENIADEAGIKAAYEAFQHFRKIDGRPIPLLPRFLTWSEDQLFFLTWAQKYCVAYTSSSLKLQMTDVHSPGKFRVNGPLSVMPQFAKAFNCSIGSAMNPSTNLGFW